VVQNGSRPLAIVARTVKGWGARIEQGTGKHGTPVKKDKLNEVLGELDQTAADLHAAHAGTGVLKVTPPSGTPAPQPAHQPIQAPSFDQAMEQMGFLKDVKAGKPFAVLVRQVGETDVRDVLEGFLLKIPVIQVHGVPRRGD
jgi:hypothetical protein